MISLLKKKTALISKRKYIVHIYIYRRFIFKSLFIFIIILSREETLCSQCANTERMNTSETTTHLALSRSDLVWFRPAADVELPVVDENDDGANPAAAAAAALAADVVAADVVVVGGGGGGGARNVLLAAGPPAATPPARTCTVTGNGPDVRTAR